jgi:hypothetical protein
MQNLPSCPEKKQFRKIALKAGYKKTNFFHKNHKVALYSSHQTVKEREKDFKSF